MVQPQSDLRLIRKLDTIFSSNLKKRIKEDPSGPGVPPVAVLSTDIQKKMTVLSDLRNHIDMKYLGDSITLLLKQSCIVTIQIIHYTIKYLLQYLWALMTKKHYAWLQGTMKMAILSIK